MSISIKRDSENEPNRNLASEKPSSRNQLSGESQQEARWPPEVSSSWCDFRVIDASQDTFGRVPSFSISWDDLRAAGWAPACVPTASHTAAVLGGRPSPALPQTPTLPGSLPAQPASCRSQCPWLWGPRLGCLPAAAEPRAALCWAPQRTLPLAFPQSGVCPCPSDQGTLPTRFVFTPEMPSCYCRGVCVGDRESCVFTH